MQLSALACLAATTAAFTSGPLRVPHSSVRRPRRLLAQLGVDWETGVDEASGQTYYYNAQTGASQWEPPQAVVPARKALWTLAPTDGVLNEYQLHSGEEQVLGRFDMVEQSPYVSRMQCIVRVANDGTASVISLGKAQTRIVIGSDAWSRRTVILGKEQTHALKDGEQIALQKDHLSGSMQAVFTVYAPAAHGDSHAQEDGYAQQGQQQWTPHPWETQVDQNGQVYYHNPQTGVVQWDPPLQ